MNEESMVHSDYMKKFLHTEQPYPDNYIEEWFLSSVQYNAHLHVQPISNTIYESLAVTQQISTVVLFICLFLTSSMNLITQEMTVYIDVALLIMCYVSCIPLNLPFSTYCSWKSIIIFGVIWGFVPVVSSITYGYDPTSIYEFSSFLFFFNIAFFDYGYANNYVDNINGILSHNTAIVGSIVMASLLQTKSKVFPIISFAIIMFEYIPIFRHYINVCFLSKYQMLLTKCFRKHLKMFTLCSLVCSFQVHFSCYHTLMLSIQLFILLY